MLSDGFAKLLNDSVMLDSSFIVILLKTKLMVNIKHYYLKGL